MLGDAARTEARAHTLLILQDIDDPVRKRNLVEFLHQSRLIHSELPVVDLRGANLDEADLSHADLSHALPIEANLSYAVLRKTNLRGAALHEANLRGAHLEGADLRDARGVTEDELEKQAENLEGTIMPDGSKHP